MGLHRGTQGQHSLDSVGYKDKEEDVKLGARYEGIWKKLEEEAGYDQTISYTYVEFSKKR